MIAMCVNVGSASSKDILICGFNPFFSSVQTPLGPLLEIAIQFHLGFITSLENDLELASNVKLGNLKSGIPAGVLIPAPVCITTCFASLIHDAKSFILVATSSTLSNF